MEERDLRPIVGQQQRDHGLGDLRIGRTSASECREIPLVGSLVIGAEVGDHWEIEGSCHATLVIARLLRSNVAVDILLP